MMKLRKKHVNLSEDAKSLMNLTDTHEKKSKKKKR